METDRGKEVEILPLLLPWMSAHWKVGRLKVISSSREGDIWCVRFLFFLISKRPCPPARQPSGSGSLVEVTGVPGTSITTLSYCLLRGDFGETYQFCRSQLDTRGPVCHVFVLRSHFRSDRRRAHDGTYCLATLDLITLSDLSQSSLKRKDIYHCRVVRLKMAFTCTYI